MSYFAIHTREDFDIYHDLSNTQLNSIYDLSLYYDEPLLKYPKRLTTLTLDNISSIQELILPERLINLYINNSTVNEVILNKNIVKMYLSSSRINKSLVNVPPSLKVFNAFKSYFVMAKISDDIEEFVFTDLTPAYLTVSPSNAKRLVLSNLGLTKLPPLGDKLVYLDVQNNELTELPEVLPHSLQVLNVSNNKLIEISVLNAKLITLDAQNNDLLELSTLSPVLETLDISNNKLTKLPDLPKSLINLNISNNHITELPDSIIECSKLGSYKADVCNIEYKPEQIRLLYLMSLTANHDKFKKKYLRGYYTSAETVGLSTTLSHSKQTVQNLLKDEVSEEMKEKIKFSLDWVKLILEENGFGTNTVTHEWCRKSSFCPQYLGTSIEELWLRIWNRILNSPNKLTLISRYIEEMTEARGRCDNGYTIRFLNVLAGFFDDVHIGLNESEQLAEVIVNEQRKTTDAGQLIKNLADIFIERGISFDQFQEWITPIADAKIIKI